MMNRRRIGRRPRETGKETWTRTSLMTEYRKTKIARGARGEHRLPLFFSYLSYLLLSQVLHSTDTPGDQAESSQESSTPALATLQSLGSAGGQSGVGGCEDDEGSSHQTTGVPQVLHIGGQGQHLRSEKTKVSVTSVPLCNITHLPQGYPHQGQHPPPQTSPTPPRHFSPGGPAASPSPAPGGKRQD